MFNVAKGLLTAKLLSVLIPAISLMMELNKNSNESNEKERLKMKITVLEESLTSYELECKASRETVLRLEEELDHERRKVDSNATDLHSLKKEMESLAVGRRNVEYEKQTLGESLEASRRVIEAARRESRCLEKQVGDLQAKAQAAEQKLQLFLEKVTEQLQGKSKSFISPSESDILQELDKLCNKTLSDMESRLHYASEELEKQTKLQRSTLQRAQLAGQQVQDLKERLQTLETTLQAADKHRDQLQHSKQHYEAFLEQLSETMKVNSTAEGLGFEMRLKLALSRAEQLFRQEADALIESRRLTFNLQQKVQSQKSLLDGKELQIQLLRKKLLDLEEKKSRSFLTVEENNALLEARKLKKKIEHLQEELRATKLSNSELRAQLTQPDELKVEGRRVWIQGPSRNAFSS